MAEKFDLGLGSEVRELKIGQSFTNPKTTAFHTVKYDFKPASGDKNKKNKISTLDVGNNHQVTVTEPHLDGAGAPQTVFKGSHRPYQKECVLIIDRVTNEITIEKLSCNIQVKKTRPEFNKLPLPPDRTSQSSSGESKSNLMSRSNTPPIGQRISNKTKVTSGSRRPDKPITHLVPKHSPLHASPSYPSPNHPNKSPKQEHRSSHHDNQSSSAQASLPMIGMDDFSEPAPIVPPATLPNPKIIEPSLSDNEIGEISTDSSSSSSDMDSDSDTERNSTAIENTLKSNGHSNGINANKAGSSMPSHLLNEDLCLSESGSDSD